MFGREKNKDITIVFLNAILQKSGHQPIVDVFFENIEIGGETAEDKQSKLDILVKTQDEKMINIEIQFNNRYDIKKRSVYYWARLFSTQLHRKEAYKKLKPVIMINIMNFDIFQKETPDFHSTFHLREAQAYFKLTDLIEVHFIEMSKLIQAWYNHQLNPWDDVLARWLLLLGTVDRRSEKIYEDIFRELEEIAMEDPVLARAFQSWQELSESQEKRLLFEMRLKYLLDEEIAVKEAQLRVEEALAEGLEQGIQKGIQQGIQQGIQEGIQQGIQQGIKEGMEKGIEKEKIEVAQNLILKGMDKDFIHEITQLPLDVIEKMFVGK